MPNLNSITSPSSNNIYCNFCLSTITISQQQSFNLNNKIYIYASCSVCTIKNNKNNLIYVVSNFVNNIYVSNYILLFYNNSYFTIYNYHNLTTISSPKYLLSINNLSISPQNALSKLKTILTFH